VVALILHAKAPQLMAEVLQYLADSQLLQADQIDLAELVEHSKESP